MSLHAFIAMPFGRKEDIAADAIARKLDKLGAGAQDLALCGGACGGVIFSLPSIVLNGVCGWRYAYHLRNQFSLKNLSFLQGKDGIGGTKHMIDTVQKYSGQIYIIDTGTFMVDKT